MAGLMLTVACVKHGTKYGARDANILRAMVTRHLKQPHRFVCLTEDAAGLADGIEVEPIPDGLTGWWCKTSLFQPNLFQGRVVYFDLDVVIVGPLDELAATKGTIWLRDWGWTRDVYGSAVMAWDAGEHEEIWERFTPDVPKRLDGDQDWLTELGGWERLPARLTRSYRYHATKAPPEGASVICFHGRPKASEIKTGWVPKMWRE